MKTFTLSVLAALALAATVADAAPNSVPRCKTWTARTPEPSGPALVALAPKMMAPVPLNAFQVIDKEITRKLVVQSITARRTEMDTVQVSARILNCTDEPLRILARTQFMDGAQSSTEPVSAWRLVIIEPQGFGTYAENSIAQSDVAHFLIEARSAR
jgi:hypothetical protein